LSHKKATKNAEAEKTDTKNSTPYVRNIPLTPFHIFEVLFSFSGLSSFRKAPMLGKYGYQRVLHVPCHMCTITTHEHKSALLYYSIREGLSMLCHPMLYVNLRRNKREGERETHEWYKGP
jgi:hypothetical protein